MSVAPTRAQAIRAAQLRARDPKGRTVVQAAALLIDPTALDDVDAAVEDYRNATWTTGNCDPETFSAALNDQEQAHGSIRDIVADQRCMIQRLQSENDSLRGDLADAQDDAETKAEALRRDVTAARFALARIASTANGESEVPT